MKIRDFTIFIESTRMLVNSSPLKLEQTKIQGRVQSDSIDKSPVIMITVIAKLRDRDSIRELKGLINESDV